MGSGRDNRDSLNALTPLVVSNLCCGFKAPYTIITIRRWNWPQETHHDWHLYIHQHNIILSCFDSFKSFEPIVNNSHNMTILFQNLYSKFLIDNIVLG